MQEQNKTPLPRAVAMCVSNLSIPIGPSLASSFTIVDIKVVVQ